MSSTLTSKGQTTLPKAIRERLNLKAGDRLDYVVEGERRIVVVPATYHLADLAKVLPRPKKRKPATIEEMDEDIRSAAIERNR